MKKLMGQDALVIPADKRPDYVNANGIKLAYETFGERQHPAVLLIHGLATQMLAWPVAFCESLAAVGFYVIRFDNRDIGLSSSLESWGQPNLLWLWLQSLVGMKPIVAYTLPDMAQDALALLDALDIKRAHVVGASMGGMIAQHMAAIQPGRVRTLTCMMSTSGASGLPEAESCVQKLMFDSAPAHDKEAAMQQMFDFWQAIASPAYPPSDEELWAFVRACGARRLPGGLNEARHLAAVLADGSRVKLLQRLKTPALVIHGTADLLVPPACGEDIARNVPGARLERVEGMGHDLPSGLFGRIQGLLTQHFSHANHANTEPML